MGRNTISRCFLVMMVSLGLSGICGTNSSVQTKTACLMAADGSSTSVPVAPVTENYATGEVKPHRWNRPQVTLALEGNIEGGHTAGETRRLLERAAQLWNSRVGSVVQIAVTDKPNPDITVAFVPSQSLPQRAVGRTSVTFGAFSGNLYHASILVQQGMPTDSCEQAVAHELGHALGIDVHSPSVDDLMFDKAHLPAMVTARDANTLRVFYGVAMIQPAPNEIGTPQTTGTEIRGVPPQPRVEIR